VDSGFICFYVPITPRSLTHCLACIYIYCHLVPSVFRAIALLGFTRASIVWFLGNGWRGSLGTLEEEKMTPAFLSVIFWTLVSFFCGSLPFSVWISRLFGKDARTVGDGNPGATNALKAGGWYVGLLSFLLDVSKGAAPVGLAYQIWGWHGWEIIPVALGPLFGSVFSVFLNFKGGKSLSVSLGIWIGLTLWKAPLIILISLSVAFLVQTLSGWAVVVSIISAAIYLLVVHSNIQLYLIGGIQALLLIWKHREDLRKRPNLRAWLMWK
jgi:glycerol-3-phosphate acyltransferase PlsY